MNRNQFLKTAGAASMGSLLIARKGFSVPRPLPADINAGCVLIPQEEAGPYGFDLSGNAAMFRQDITEGNPGTPVNLTLTIVNVNDNCSPIQSARVDIWHCNKDGYYSEFGNQPGYLGTQSHTGETFFRGIQLTDANGVAQFKTIYPGWYPGRVTHIHLEMFLSSALSATTQVAFPEDITTAVYNTSLYSVHGQNPTTNSTDSVFSDTSNTQYETLAVGPNATTGGFDASITIGIAAPTSGVINLAPETGGQFKLGQNYPNPFVSETVIPFTLTNPAYVRIELFDLTGRRVVEVMNGRFGAGNHTLPIRRDMLPAPLGSFVYQISVENEVGTFRQCRVLTLE